MLLPAAAFVLLVFVSFAVPFVRDEPYDWQAHVVTAAKFFEYALLAPALLLLVRRREDARPLLAVLILMAIVAGIVALLQFSGAVSTWDGTPAGRRKPSLLGYHDYSALAGSVLALGLAGLAFGDRRRHWVWASLASGGIGVVLAGAVSGLAGLFAAAALLLILAARRRSLSVRRGAVIASVLILVAAGTVAIRSSALTDLAGFLGGDTDRDPGVQTYAAPNAARLHRLPDLPRPSRHRRRLAGIGRRTSLTARTSMTRLAASRPNHRSRFRPLRIAGAFRTPISRR